MNELKLRQLNYECQAWKRSLGFIIDENIQLKNRLSEIIQNTYDAELLDEIEYFQGRLIKEDDRISLIRNDLTDLGTLPVIELFENGKISAKVTSKFTKLRNNILNAEKQFSELKSEFSFFIMETLAGEK